jgi:hypothetical protein
MPEPIRSLSEIKPGDILRRVARDKRPWDNECLVKVVGINYYRDSFFKEYLEGPAKGRKEVSHLQMGYKYFHHTEAEPENMWV